MLSPAPALRTATEASPPTAESLLPPRGDAPSPPAPLPPEAAEDEGALPLRWRRWPSARLSPLLLVLAAIVILELLIALLVLYLASGRPRWAADDPTIPAPSELGQHWQGLFIATGAVAAAAFVAAIVLAEGGRLTRCCCGCRGGSGSACCCACELADDPIALPWLALICGAISGLALILLTVFSSGPAHATFAVLLFVGLAIVLGIELALLRMQPRPAPAACSAWSVAVAALICGIVLAVATGILYAICSDELSAGAALSASCDAVVSTASVLEWFAIVAFIVAALALAADAAQLGGMKWRRGGGGGGGADLGRSATPQHLE